MNLLETILRKKGEPHIKYLEGIKKRFEEIIKKEIGPVRIRTINGMEYYLSKSRLDKQEGSERMHKEMWHSGSYMNIEESKILKGLLSLAEYNPLEAEYVYRQLYENSII